ncbi:bacterio-opsin activator domain-containing protein [Natronococcus occultus]|uniref:Putative DNA binding protein n=1 Tax=Natronococcus occultus SP4 TaxID=694430 RepID=L0JWZ1_9EURY|nr:bacterio-opsin activator domain-containing protein [Natronococcus occultus]AGB36363.1 putative DNA binding protein [Natronococcus occultus SP4]
MSDSVSRAGDDTDVGGTLELLLIEDNPGDARLIQEMLRDATELTQRVNPDESTNQAPTVIHEDRLEDGIETLESSPPDLVLLDLNLPDSRGLDTLESVSTIANETPIVVFTGVSDQEVGVQAIQSGAQDFLVKDEVTDELLIRTIHHAIERAHQERQRRRQREQLESLNRLNRIGHDITHAVITTETRAELEQEVCDRLVEDDGYRFAWLGSVNPGSDRIEPTAAAGAEDGYLDEIEVTADPEDERGQGPSGTAIRTGEVQVADDTQTDETFGPWKEAASDRGYRSSIAIPIVHEDLVYGVLNVYSESVRSFTDAEATILSRIGDVIAHAITAIERKDALVSDAVIELEFRIEEMAPELIALSTEESCTIRFDQMIHGDETLLVYGSATDLDQETFLETIEETDGLGDARVLSARKDYFEFELVAPTAVSLFETIATHGGRVESATIEDGEFRFVVELPRGRDTRQMIELLKEHRSDVTYLAQRTTERSERSESGSESVLESDLTEKQRAALETAYFAGYFDWPRESTGEEIADRLGISPATFNQHLRTSERKFFDSVLGE